LNITSQAYDLLTDTSIGKKIFSSITSTIVSIDNYNQDVSTVLNLRNLFDVIELNDTMPYCRANLLHENQNIILRKTYMSEKEPRDVQPMNSVMIKIKIKQDTNENMRIILFKNGNYVVKTDWREENHMDFASITKIVSEKINPIIKLINKYDDSVKYHKIQLVEITSNNVVFTETAMSFYYDSDVSETKFNIFKRILDDFRKADIIKSKESVSIGTEYFFNKGMYKYDSTRIEKTITLDNYYEFLSNGIVQQKWNSIFNRTRLFQVINISSKLKITIAGIRDSIELEIFLMYLHALYHIYDNNTAHIKTISSEFLEAKSKKALKNLKVQDPLLYDFKKIYKSDVIYSKICQKPYQPMILSETEYEKLPADKKSKAIKYWNFTQEKPVWYSCPNIKFPYIKFIIKQHPKDFCIPCCKKIQMNKNVNIKKQEIHNKCLTKHIYEGEKINLTKGSHYIASYGKNIELGRISRLPENTLEPLFFDTYSPDGIIDQECVTADGYYLFGVEQNMLNISNVGLIHCIMHSLSMNNLDFINDCISRIKKDTDKFRILLEGNAGMYFKNVNEMISLIADLDKDMDFNPLPEDIPWNMLFMSIAYYYYGINIILFDDQQKERIELILPKGLKNHNEMFPDSHKNLVILRHKAKYYPIYLFNTNIFKRTGLIDTKLFHNESGLITIIKAVVRKTFENNNVEKIKTHIDLATIKEFCKDNNVKIVHYYINYSNLCYSVVLSYKDMEIYLPVMPSHYPLEKNISLIFTPYNAEYNADYKDLVRLLNLFKQWNDKKSKQAGLDGINLYPNIEVQQWIKIRNSNLIIGFIHNNTNYFIKDLDHDIATKYANVPIQTLLYDPKKINNLIHKVKQGSIKTITNPKIETKLNNSLYDYYLHNLVLIHLINVFNKQRNLPLRKKIILILSKTDFTKSVENVKNLLNSLSDQDDINKIKNIISRYITIHHDKKRMIYDINNTYFNFDRVELEKLKGLSVADINSKLHKIAESFVKIGTPKISKFPNILVACNEVDSGVDKVGRVSSKVGSVVDKVGSSLGNVSSASRVNSASRVSSNVSSKIKNTYCDKNKLIIEKNKLDAILDIISSDVQNPAKWKWILNSVFTVKTVEYFKFIRRKYEAITIEFV